MNKVCDFTAQSGNAAHKVTQLTFENECLRQEVTELKNEISSISDKTNSQSESISSLQSKIDEIKESYSLNLTEHTANVTEQMQHQKELYSSSVGLYEGLSTFLTVIIAIGGIITFAFVGYYKKQQVKDVTDSAKSELSSQINEGDFLISAVVNAFDHPSLQEKIDLIKSEIIENQETVMQSMFEDRINNEESASFRDVFRSDVTTGEE